MSNGGAKLSESVVALELLMWNCAVAPSGCLAKFDGAPESRWLHVRFLVYNIFEAMSAHATTIVFASLDFEKYLSGFRG